MSFIKTSYIRHINDLCDQKYETEMIEKNDTHFFVGTLLQYPGTWNIIGLFYPPRSSQGEMFAD